MCPGFASADRQFDRPRNKCFWEWARRFILIRQCLGHKAIGSMMKYIRTSDVQASEAAQAALMRLY